MPCGPGPFVWDWNFGSPFVGAPFRSEETKLSRISRWKLPLFWRQILYLGVCSAKFSPAAGHSQTQKSKINLGRYFGFGPPFVENCDLGPPFLKVRPWRALRQGPFWNALEPDSCGKLKSPVTNLRIQKRTKSLRIIPIWARVVQGTCWTTK